MKPLRIIASLAALAGIAACGHTVPLNDPFADQATLMPVTKTGATLETIPRPTRALDVAVYAFPDLTGANENEDEFSTLSRAVTQGGAHVLVDVLKDVGGGSWFEVAERTGVSNLLQEREIIERTQIAFQGRSTLPALRFAGILIEGAIVGYDTNEATGGTGARFLGIGGFQNYRRDIVTVSLRAVSVSTGRVLTATTTTKTVYSVQVQGGAFRYVSVGEIAEYETGFSRNEPEIIAVREAMELAVLGMIVEGAKRGEWRFADQAAGQKLIQEYDQGFVRDRFVGQYTQTTDS